MRRATRVCQGDNVQQGHFYPRSPCGERHLVIFGSNCRNKFLSTLSLRRATDYKGICVQNLEFLSTLSLRRATVVGASQGADIGFLSTLSLRRATPIVSVKLTKLVFLSTLSLRRATNRPLMFLRLHRYFYPRSPCGERLTAELDVP